MLLFIKIGLVSSGLCEGLELVLEFDIVVFIVYALGLGFL